MYIASDLTGCAIGIASTLSDLFAGVLYPYHEETPWREFVGFLEDNRVQLVIKNYKYSFLKVRLFFRRLMPANRVLYIKRKRNKNRCPRKKETI